MIGYQTYSLAAGLKFDVLGGTDMIAHHSSVLVLCLTAYYPWAHYYAIFFIGAAEFSTVILCFMDMFKHVPELGEAIPGADLFFRLSFTASFVVIRLGFWMYISCCFLSDCYTLIATEKHHSCIVLAIYVVCNIGLCLLQAYWGYLIGKSAYNMAFPSSKAQKTD